MIELRAKSVGQENVLVATKNDEIFNTITEAKLKKATIKKAYYRFQFRF